MNQFENDHYPKMETIVPRKYILYCDYFEFKSAFD